MSLQWASRPLGEVCTVRPPKAEAEKRVGPHGTVSFVPMEDLGIGAKTFRATKTAMLSEVSGSYTYFADGDVLLAKITPCFENGKLGVASGLVSGIGFGSSEFLVIRPSGELDKDFLYYWLSRDAFRREGSARMGGAVGQQRVPRQFVESAPIPVPPLSEQRRIVAILDRAFEGIAAARANAEGSLANTRRTFQAARDRVFRQVPARWHVVRLGDVAATQYGLSEGMNDENKGYRIFRMGEVQDGRLVDTGRMRCADVSPAEFEKYRLRGGDILFNRTNSFELVGKTGIFELDGDYCFASYLVRVLPDRGRLIPRFMNYLMNSDRFQRSVKSKASRSINQANINASILRNEQVWFPPSLDEQSEIAASLGAISMGMRRLEIIYRRKLAALDELKQSLLHQAFSGNL